MPKLISPAHAALLSLFASLSRLLLLCALSSIPHPAKLVSSVSLSPFHALDVADRTLSLARVGKNDDNSGMEKVKVTLEDLQITAGLARLPLDEAELQAALPAFQGMLAYFTAMQNADSDVEAFGGALQDDVNVSCFTAETGHFRPDVQNAEKSAAPQSMLELAGERDGNFIVMPNVL